MPSIYVHIPFCRSKCAYCDFFSQTRQVDSERFVAALEKEFQLRRDDFGKKFSSLYIGGGTPSLMPIPALSSLVGALFPHLERGAEITIEANPDDLSDDFAAFLACSHVNRVSVGLQSMQNDVLRAAKRRSDRKTNLAALRILNDLQKAGKRASADMISGLPAETMDGFLSGLEEVAEAEIRHISLYALTIEDGTPLAHSIRKGALRYDQDFADEMWIAGRDFLLQRGFSHYEISNFARGNEFSRHNAAYWHCEDYCGIGPGAVGCRWNANARAKRWNNFCNVEKWIDGVEKANEKTDLEKICNVESVSSEEQMFEYVMLAFRTSRGVVAEDFKARFGCNFAEKYAAAIEKWRAKGFLQHFCDDDGERFALTEDGMLFHSHVVQDF